MVTSSQDDVRCCDCVINAVLCYKWISYLQSDINKKCRTSQHFSTCTVFANYVERTAPESFVNYQVLCLADRFTLPAPRQSFADMITYCQGIITDQQLLRQSFASSHEGTNTRCC